MTTATQHTVRLGARDYPVILPNWRDTRLHLAAVIISIHVLGQTSFGFRVSVPQILSAIFTCAVIEVVWTFYQDRKIVWPASAMLTGSGVALILRLVSMQRGDHWSWQGWEIFALVAGFSLVSKYVIRWRGSHVFNPSNFGLVVAFLVLGSSIIEPLDFWWTPMSLWLALAYLLILLGGLMITSRLRLFAMGAVFWLTLSAGLGLVSASGHCITAAWALQPVCGAEFWWVVITSPEVLIFLFFMITDPKTIPSGRWARVAFALALGAICTFLIAPASNEFWAKVGLLGGLVVLTPFRVVFDRLLPDGADHRVPRPVRGLLVGPRIRVFLRGAVVGSVFVLLGAALVAAGAPARSDGVATLPSVASTPDQIGVEIDASTLPVVGVDPEARGLNADVAGNPGALAVALAQDLAVEAQAVEKLDPSLLRIADGGDRLVAMERQIESAATEGSAAVSNYRFDTLDLTVAYADGPQGGADLALVATGTVEQVTYAADGTESKRDQAPFHSTFVLGQNSAGRWVITSETKESP